MKEIFERCKVKGKVFDSYIKERGFLLGDVEPFNLGLYRYKPSDWLSYKFVKAADESIFLPIYDDMLNPSGFELRTTKNLKLHAKYYDPNARYYFFGFTKESLQEIFDTETVFLTEGTFKTIAFSRWKKNVLGLMNNKVTESQKIFLRRYVKNIYLCFDFDKWGLIMQKNIVEELTKEGFNAKIFPHVVGSDGVKDADDLMKKLGRDKFIRTMERRFKELGSWV